MITYIVSEGSFQAQLLETLLPANLLNDVGVASAGRAFAVKSLARSLVVRRRVPVIIVFDADSVVPELVEQRCKDIQETVESVSIDTQIKVVPAVPEIEIIFFQDVSLLSRLLGYIAVLRKMRYAHGGHGGHGGQSYLTFLRKAIYLLKIYLIWQSFNLEKL